MVQHNHILNLFFDLLRKREKQIDPNTKNKLNAQKPQNEIPLMAYNNSRQSKGSPK